MSRNKIDTWEGGSLEDVEIHSNSYPFEDLVLEVGIGKKTQSPRNLYNMYRL